MTGKQLKNSILQWAIQGKLVPQDPNDEPASVLLEKIRAEKARLVKEGKIKRDKNESIIYRGEDNSHYEKFLATGEVKCIDEEIPFEIPDTWCWERWGNLSQSIQYGYNSPAEETGDIRMVRISDIQAGDVQWNGVPYCHINPDEIENYLLRKDDILFARTGGTVGKSFLVKETPYPAIYAGYLIRTRYSRMLVAQYMKFFMESQLYWEQLRNGTIATAQPNCNGKTLSKMILPIPPYREQIRITDKLNAVLKQVHKYGKVQYEQNNLYSQIHDSLKKSILQEAIQGKLVPQDPTDEPAYVLLERIKEEKAKLFKEGKLKKKDIVDSIIFRGDDNKYYEQVGGICIDISEEVPFDTPPTWAWSRIRNLFQTSSGGTPEKGHPEYYGGNIPWVKVGDLTSMYIEHVEDYITEEGLVHSSAKIFPKGTILVAMYCNDAIGKSSILSAPMTTNQAICGLYPNNLLNAEYIYFVIQSLKAKLQEHAAGGAQKNINQKIVNELLIPIPPFIEQQRIVNMIETLFDRIKG